MTVVADAGMISEANQEAIAGRRVVVHPGHPHPLRAAGYLAMARPTPWSRRSLISRCSPSRGRPTTTKKTRSIPDRVIYYQYRHDRARRTLRGIDEQVGKAEKSRRRKGFGQT